MPFLEKFFTAILTLTGATFGGWPLDDDEDSEAGTLWWEQE
ncbi:MULTISPECIES: hypothetical protein [unclassified Rhodococcus (in: high G+C Gram-positive bacteria)]|nr:MULTISPECIES: hypothetical protein [unclassified Rhodococcus (in: high G+C Gram-positive bacteria)]